MNKRNQLIRGRAFGPNHFSLALGLLAQLSGAVWAQSAATLDKEPKDPVVARVGEQQILLSEVDRRGGATINAILQKLYDARLTVLDDMIDSTLLRAHAKNKGISVGLLLQQVESELNPSDLLEDANRDWVGQFESLRVLGEEVGKQRAWMTARDQRWLAGVKHRLQELRKEADVHVSLPKPNTKLSLKPTTSVLGGSPSGEQLFLFVDYECPFCKVLDSEVMAIRKSLGSNAKKVVVKQFPLPSHRTALVAARAAVCAGKTDKFDLVHSMLFEMREHVGSVIGEKAASIGLDRDDFEKCMNDGDSLREVLADIEEGKRGGIQATPTMVLGGEILTLPANDNDLRKFLHGVLSKSNSEHISQGAQQ